MRADRETQPELLEGLVARSARGGEYDVLHGAETLLCRVSGRLKGHGLSEVEHVVVGDRVSVVRDSHEPELRGRIQEVLPRRNTLIRGRPGKPAQALIANIDQVVVVAATLAPWTSLHAIDRFLVIAALAGVPAMLVVNKVDLDPEGEALAEIREVYQPLDIPVLATSAEDRLGLEAVDDALAGRVSAVFGRSGAGKSSLLNALNPGYQLRTGEVMDIGKGRHTTTETRLLPLDRGGFVADTPGIKTLQLMQGQVAPRELQVLFPEIHALADDCRFADCTHRDEPGCAVRAAAADGAVAESRYDSYTRLYAEVEAETRPR